MTQTTDFGTTCPKAGFGEAPQQVFLRPSQAAKIASVATLALLAVSAYPEKDAKNRGRVFYTSSVSLASFNACIVASITRSSFSSSEFSITSMRLRQLFSGYFSGKKN